MSQRIWIRTRGEESVLWLVRSIQSSLGTVRFTAGGRKIEFQPEHNPKPKDVAPAERDDAELLKSNSDSKSGIIIERSSADECQLIRCLVLISQKQSRTKNSTAALGTASRSYRIPSSSTWFGRRSFFFIAELILIWFYHSLFLTHPDHIYVSISDRWVFRPEFMHHASVFSNSNSNS